MRCPYCSHDEDKVIDSRPAEDGTTIRRRRECLSCDARFTTYEKIETTPLLVIKKDGTREPFSREKLARGILRSFEKRPISLEQIESLATKIESVPRNQFRKEVTSDEIGDLVLQELKAIDEVAYVRFASVYRRFQDVNSFMSELQNLLTEQQKAGK